jgi:hypothetical protein
MPYRQRGTSNIQAIELNVFEIFKQAKFEDEQLIRYFLFQFQFHIVIKSGLASTIVFHK